MVWPAVIWVFPRQRLSSLCAAMALIAFAVRCWMSAVGASTQTIYQLTPCRLDCLAVGAFVAIGVQDFRPQLDRWTPRIFALCSSGFLVVVAVSPNPVWSDLAMRTFGASLLALGYGCVVFRAATGHIGWTNRLFASPLLGKLGKYSYGMYVLHAAPWELTAFFVRELDNQRLPQALILAIKYSYFPALLAVSFGLSWLSMRFLEHPFLTLKARLPYGKRSRGLDRLPAPLIRGRA